MPRHSRFKSGDTTIQSLLDSHSNSDPKRVGSFSKALANARAAQAIYDLRTAAGLTQAELAKRVGTSTSAISRLEDAEYGGHTLAIIARIAAAVGRRVELTFPYEDEGGLTLETTATTANRRQPKPRATDKPKTSRTPTGR